MAYTITLHFTAGDHSYTVLRDGYKLNRLVGAKGRHATQGCQLKIRSHEASILLLQEEAPLIRAELMEDEDLLFQGVVRPYQSVGARNKTLDSFSLEILDDTEILTNTRITERADYFDKTLSWCIGHMYDMADLPEELVIPASADAISLAYFNVDPEMYSNVAEFLSALLFEYGLDYRFTADQCQIIPTTVSGSSSLLPRAQLRNRFQISREDNWTDGIKVNYGVAEICSQIPLAWWKEDISEPAAWRYVLPWSYSDSSGHVTRTVSYEPFYGYPASQKPADFKTEYILSVMNCRATAERCTVISLNPNARSIAIEFSWDQRQNYVWGNPIADWPYISVIGDIVYAIPGTYQEQIVGEKPDTFTLSFLRGQEGAKVFAEREYKRAKVAPTTYTFQSLAEHVPGAFYRIVDTVTGIDVVVRILSCATDADGICSIKAESADYIGMSVETENLKLRDNLDVGASVILTADKTLVSSGYATITATGRLMEIIDNEDPSTFRFTWEFNGSAKPEWTGMTQVLAYYSALETGANTVRIIVSHMEGGQTIELGSSSLTITKVVEGADGASAEIQYAIGSSITDPPMDEMLWNDVPMTWGGDPMLWQQGMWGDEVPEMQRGQYIWMRARVGDGPWQYTRLTGTTSWDVEGLGVATTACPTESREGLPLIPGDYFIAGATFTDPVDGNEYKKGFAYSYTGSGWEVLDLMDLDNSAKALQCLSDLMTSGINVTDSTASIWGWFQNLVAQSAVINSLVVELATIKNLVITGNIFNDVLTTNNSVTTTTTYTFISSHQTIGSVTREWLKISDIESAMGSSSISVLCTGTVVIAGTSYTGTLSNPISVKYVKNTSLRISQGSQLCWFSYSTITNEYLAEVSDKALSSNALTVTANVGSISVHSVLPQNSNYDNLASNEIPFNKGWIKELFVKNVHGLNYTYAWTTTRGDYITDNNSHSMTFTYDGEAFVNVSASLTSSDYAVNSGLMTLRTGSYAHAPSGCVCLPLYGGSSIISSFIILEFSINPVSGTITYRSQGATSSREIYVEFQFFK